MDLQKLCWTLVVLIGLAANVRMLGHAVARRRQLRKSGQNGALAVIARQAVRREATTLLLQSLIATLFALAWTHQDPSLPSARHFYVLSGWVIMVCSALLTADSLFDVWDLHALWRCCSPDVASPTEDARRLSD